MQAREIPDDFSCNFLLLGRAESYIFRHSLVNVNESWRFFKKVGGHIDFRPYLYHWFVGHGFRYCEQFRPENNSVGLLAA